MRFDTSLDRPLIAPTPRDLFAVIFRQQRVVLVSFIVVLLGMSLSWLLTPRYRAHMKILVRRERLDPVVSSEASVTQNKPEEMSEEELNSEVELLNSQELLRKVVLATGLQNTQPAGAGIPQRPKRGGYRESHRALAFPAQRRALTQDQYHLGRV